MNVYLVVQFDNKYKYLSTFTCPLNILKYCLCEKKQQKNMELNKLGKMTNLLSYMLVNLRLMKLKMEASYSRFHIHNTSLGPPHSDVPVISIGRS